MLDAGTPAETIQAEVQRMRRESPRPPASIDDIADHIEHVRDVAGIDHVGIGSDYDGMNAPPEMPDVSSYPALFARLIERGWSDEDLGKLASGNILRALHEAEAAAERLQGEREPSTAVITDFAEASS
jgi:membrane dipeptidase